jgi:U5 snRNP spliceosome subunit
MSLDQTSINLSGVSQLEKVPPPPPCPPPPPPCPPPPPSVSPPVTITNDSASKLLKKYKLEGGFYHSINPSSMFENMISCVPGGGCFQALEVWKTPTMSPVRAIDDKIRKGYRKQSGGHGGYTFHSLSKNEMDEFRCCLLASL